LGSGGFLERCAGGFTWSGRFPFMAGAPLQPNFSSSDRLRVQKIQMNDL
jgi:hypothetical protein